MCQCTRCNSAESPLTICSACYIQAQQEAAKSFESLQRELRSERVQHSFTKELLQFQLELNRKFKAEQKSNSNPGISV
jgi:hypothetical protein